jgi:hypothetical protein
MIVSSNVDHIDQAGSRQHAINFGLKLRLKIQNRSSEHVTGDAANHIQVQMIEMLGAHDPQWYQIGRLRRITRGFVAQP